MWKRLPPNKLTPREREVLDLLRRGLTNDEIAQRLDVSVAGAKYHVSPILSKLGVQTREEAASLSLDERWRWPSGWPLWARIGGAAAAATAAAALVVALGLGGMGSERDEEAVAEPQTTLGQCDWNQYGEPGDVPLYVFEWRGVDFLFPNTLGEWCASEVIQDYAVVRSWPSENGECNDPWGVLPEGQLASISLNEMYSCGSELYPASGESSPLEPIHPAECDEIFPGEPFPP
jgi:DNA-binding CsgD family transcriptional regulator